MQSVSVQPGRTAAGVGCGFAAAVAPEQELKLWDVSTGMETLNMQGHTMGVCGVAFRPDGGQLASASADGTIKLWDVQPGSRPSNRRNARTSLRHRALSHIRLPPARTRSAGEIKLKHPYTFKS